MRVEVSSIEDFCQELTDDRDMVHRRIVRFRIDRIPEQEEGVSFEVRVWATALIRTPEGDYVLECGTVAGTDIPGETMEGSEAAEACRKQVLRVAETYDLRVRRGKIEVW